MFANCLLCWLFVAASLPGWREDGPASSPRPAPRASETTAIGGARQLPPDAGDRAPRTVLSAPAPLKTAGGSTSVRLAAERARFAFGWVTGRLADSPVFCRYLPALRAHRIRLQI